MKRVIAALALVALVGCGGSRPPRAGNDGADARSAPLGNGFYSILGQSEDEAEARKAAGREEYRMLPYDHVYTESSGEPREWVALSPAPYVPFVCDGPPEMGVSEKGFASLSIALAPENAKLLEDFTREHLNQHVAIVIGGEVITTHTVRSVITGGKIQITRCHDNACEVLKTRLLEQPAGGGTR